MMTSSLLIKMMSSCALVQMWVATATPTSVNSTLDGSPNIEHPPACSQHSESTVNSTHGSLTEVLHDGGRQ